jgi:hypothetical protein
VFFVTAEQNKIIEKAVNAISHEQGKTKSQRRAEALTAMAKRFLALPRPV